jgi:hypothetical protein
MAEDLECQTCGGLGIVDAGGSAYDALRLRIGLPDTYELPCPDCEPAMALKEILGVCDLPRFES